MSLANHFTGEKRRTAIQFLKYGVVGVMNTAITLIVIFLCKSVFGVNEYVSNAIGYVAGLVNSFLWNRRWVFNSHGALSHQALHFLLGFCICYALQFLVVWLINQSWFGEKEFLLLGFWTISGYGVATLVGNVAYTLFNFAYNRLVTFKD